MLTAYFLTTIRNAKRMSQNFAYIYCLHYESPARQSLYNDIIFLVYSSEYTSVCLTFKKVAPQHFALECRTESEVRCGVYEQLQGMCVFTQPFILLFFYLLPTHLPTYLLPTYYLPTTYLPTYLPVYLST